MKRLQHCLTLAFTLVPLLALCGCGNYQELSHFDLAARIAVDRLDDQYALTIELLDLSGSADENQTESYHVKTEGETIALALENARRQLSKNIHLGNMEVIVLSEEIAQDEGLRELMDWFTRDTDIRESVDLVIARQAEAGEILSAGSPDSSVASYALENLIHPADQKNAQLVRTSLYRITDILYTEGKSLVLPAVGLQTEGEEPLLDAEGLAVFQDDRLVGFLEQEQVSDYMYLMNRAENRVFVFDTGTGKPASVSATSYTSSRELSVEDGLPVFHITLQIDARADQLPDEFSLDPFLNDLEKKAAATLTRQLKRTVRIIQDDLGSDILWLGYDVYLRDKKLWDDLAPSWEDQFGSVRVEVDTQVRIRNTGNTGRS